MAQQRFYGKHRGIVVNNDDEQKRGRLLVQVPSVLGTTEVWALPCVPYAGDQQGFYFMPEPNTGVWVEFEGGNLQYPIWTGCFWFENQIDEADAHPHIRFLKTKRFSLRIDDNKGDILIRSADDTQLLLTAIDITLKSAAVYAQATNGRKVTLSATSVSINDGTLEIT